MFSIVSVWYLVVSGVITVIAISLGCIYTRLRQKNVRVSKATVSAGNQLSARTQLLDVQLDDKKWPTGSTQPLDTATDKQPSAPTDPVDYCSHIQRQVKKTRQRIAQQKIEATMTREQRDEEREVQRKQLEEIFRLMEEQKEKFGIKDADDVKEQLKLYVQ
jgi:uncharacterized membrane protein YccC